MDNQIITDKFTEVSDQFEKIISECKTKVTNFYSGTVNTHILDDIICEYYGEPHRLFEIATIKKGSANNELNVRPYDIKLIPKILILIENKLPNNVASNVCDGYIKVVFSPMTTNAKNDIVRALNEKRENFHIRARNNRHVFLTFLNKYRSKISDDLFSSQKDKILLITNSTVKTIDSIFRAKEEQIYKV